MGVHRAVGLSVVPLLILVLLTQCSVPTPTPASPTMAPSPEPLTVRVVVDGSGDYAKLEEAVQGVPEGSRIVLGPGTHRLEMPLHIDKALTLEGAGMDQTEVVFDDQGYVLRFAGGGAFAAEGITFRHEGEAWADVVVVEGGRVSLTRCRFASASGAGLSLAGNTLGSVRDSLFEGNAGTVGILVKGQAEPSLERNDCSGNGYGIRVSEQAQPTLVGNICSNNRFDGIKYDGSSGGLARENECAGNRTGIAVAEGAQPTLEGNILSQNRTSCMGYYDDAGGLARRNQCSDGFAGIGVSDRAQPTLEENTCSNNVTAGIGYFGDAGGVARRNQCSGNGVHGIGVFGQAGPLLEENITTGNGSAGISYADGAGGLARNNESSGNQVGIHVAATADPELETNQVHDNSVADIQDLRP